MSRTVHTHRSQSMHISYLTFLGAALGSLISFSAAVSAQGNCSAPAMPDMPDGASASLEQMLAGQKAVKAFQESNMEYMQCLEQRYTAAEAVTKSAKDEAKVASALAEYTESIDAYNAAVSAEENIAGAFNIELREYKAANR